MDLLFLQNFKSHCVCVRRVCGGAHKNRGSRNHYGNLETSLKKIEFRFVYFTKGDLVR
jgi:hypothetical protein